MSKKIGLIIGPILFTTILLSPAPSPLDENMWKVVACGAWIIAWWFTEAIPIAATSLLPIILFPLVNVVTVNEVVKPYASPIIFLFMGGFMLAIGMEKHNLHQRIALNILKLTGTEANQIILGFMLATGLMSMWVSNTATTVMMLPIALSVIELISHTDKLDPKDSKNFGISLMLGIAFAANIGGTATIIGTPPNFVFAGFMEKVHNIEISFLDWMLVGVPFAFIMLALAFLVLVHLVYPNKIGDFRSTGSFVDKRLIGLGKPSKGEIGVFLTFMLTAFLWVFKSKLNDIVPFPVHDAMIAMFGGVLLFIIPTHWKNNERILNWEDTKKLLWGV
ncbi:MAG: anion permease, partial [Saprospiraceae bacterium]|nr:anion permease [Saprospiraceae bacterium]